MNFVSVTHFTFQIRNIRVEKIKIEHSVFSFTFYFLLQWNLIMMMFQLCAGVVFSGTWHRVGIWFEDVIGSATPCIDMKDVIVTCSRYVFSTGCVYLCMTWQICLRFILWALGSSAPNLWFNRNTFVLLSLLCNQYWKLHFNIIINFIPIFPTPHRRRLKGCQSHIIVRLWWVQLIEPNHVCVFSWNTKA